MYRIVLKEANKRNITLSKSKHTFHFPKLKSSYNVSTLAKYSLQGTTQGNGLTGGLPPVRFSM